MHPRLKLDLTALDFARALAACARRPDPRVAAQRLEAQWSATQGVSCLSVRTGFDALLAELQLPPGAEVLMSAVTIPDMARLVRHHGLVPVPVDLSADTLAPRLDALEAARSHRSRVLVVAHLLGGRVDLAPLAAFARRHGLLLVEDCAQAFRSPQDTGHPDADVSMFSFGAIKTMTALGGALLRVRDAGLRQRVKQRLDSYPVASTAAWARKVLKLAALHGVANPVPYGAFARALTLTGKDLDDVVGPAVKGFPLPEVSGPDAEAVRAQALVERLRFQPPGALLEFLAHRLATWDEGTVARRAQAGERVRAALPRGAFLPGHAALARTHWIFAVAVEDRAAVVHAMRRAGFDASCSTSSLHAVAPAPQRPEQRAVVAEEVLRDLVFLPVYASMSTGELDRLVVVLRETVSPPRALAAATVSA